MAEDSFSRKNSNSESYWIRAAHVSRQHSEVSPFWLECRPNHRVSALFSRVGKNKQENACKVKNSPPERGKNLSTSEFTEYFSNQGHIRAFFVIQF